MDSPDTLWSVIYDQLDAIGVITRSKSLINTGTSVGSACHVQNSEPSTVSRKKSFDSQSPPFDRDSRIRCIRNDSIADYSCEHLSVKCEYSSYIKYNWQY